MCNLSARPGAAPNYQPHRVQLAPIVRDIVSIPTRRCGGQGPAVSGPVCQRATQTSCTRGPCGAMGADHPPATQSVIARGVAASASAGQTCALTALKNRHYVVPFAEKESLGIYLSAHGSFIQAARVPRRHEQASTAGQAIHKNKFVYLNPSCAARRIFLPRYR
ncbi:hypothetical protein PsYK624_078040 [Phanerochaete sordida]|uniref:Uncharacterized protein n=1 Tax=Phanerochaete sordida TaxID=48140 RepID=A0A9P3GD68_9APHY|nr:hypothetical protein PsYK624_078040 [Phanerochaete sordida]